MSDSVYWNGWFDPHCSWLFIALNLSRIIYWFSIRILTNWYVKASRSVPKCLHFLWIFEILASNLCPNPFAIVESNWTSMASFLFFFSFSSSFILYANQRFWSMSQEAQFHMPSAIIIKIYLSHYEKIAWP